MESAIMTLIIAFIAAAIMLAVGVTILGNASNGFDCSNLSGNATTGWQKACLDIQKQSQE